MVSFDDTLTLRSPEVAQEAVASPYTLTTVTEAHPSPRQPRHSPPSPPSRLQA